jgi:ATP-dependent metalloprotease FtsH
MFTDKAQALLDLARDRAFSLAREEVDVESLLAAIGASPEGGVRLAESLGVEDVAGLRAKCPEVGRPVPGPPAMTWEPDLRRIVATALDLASGEGVPDRSHPGWISPVHVVCAVAMSEAAVRVLGVGSPAISRDDAVRLLAAWVGGADETPSLGDLVAGLKDLRRDLLAKVFGQDHAAHAFVEGLYNAEVTAAADKERRRPAAVFVFVGPPGVGKTYMSELAAQRLGRPFRRFDMTGYADHQAHNQLVGFPPSYHGAQGGQLTEFVAANPNAVLLFDEIEKAHLNTVQLFYQILDAGRLEDKFLAKDVSFRDTILIFTTNAGRSLYDDPNRSGIGVANATYHRRTILGALENEKNPSDGRPAFPPAICSRLGQGYPVMFNHLGVNELERIVDGEMLRTEALLERQYFKTFRHDGRLPIAVVFREGARADARQLRAEAEKLVKAELFKVCGLYARDRLEDVLEDVDDVGIVVDEQALASGGSDVRRLFDPEQKPRVLLVAGPAFAGRCLADAPEIEWSVARSPQEALEILAVHEVDFVLLDLWLQRPVGDPPLSGHDGQRPQAASVQQDMACVPFSARALEQGRETLRLVHERFPRLPVYLLSLNVPQAREAPSPDDRGAASAAALCATVAVGAGLDAPEEPQLGEETARRPIDDELFLACVRAGGARGLMATDFCATAAPTTPASRQRFVEALEDVRRRVHREREATELAREHKTLSFETVASVDRGRRRLVIRLRGFRLGCTVDASDAGELVEDVQRPATRFDDVLGASEAKKAMQFIVDWLADPRRYKALGLRPPKGVLLAGPPGTGKTMLARAVAGEARCAFLEKSATSFVTMWQGSGPQNVRDVFARARRYAPAIVFIDEIDAIGKERTGGPSGRAQEETLNALLTEMDGFRAEAQAPVIVLAATNMAEQLDEALKRRFDRTIEVDRPDRAARLTYLKRCFANRQNASVSDAALQRLAGQSAGMTIANLERIVQEAGVMAAQAGSGITDALFEEAFEKARMGQASSTPEPAMLERIARHEAGHTLVAWLGGNKPVQVTIVGRGGAGGYMERESDEERVLYTKPQLEQMIREAMGGRAAEILYYGNEEGLSTGVAADLRHATQKAVRMVREFGMDGEMGQVALHEVSGQRPDGGELAMVVARRAQAIVSAQLDRTLALLRADRARLDRLASELLTRNRLTRDELEVVLEGG